jgi:hypothetical protein
MKEHEVTTTYQLIGKYLSLKGEGVEPVEHADRFYFWLKNIGKVPQLRCMAAVSSLL